EGDQQVRRARRERAGRDRQCADQAIARENLRPLRVRRALCDRSLFERDVHADAGVRIHRADEGNDGDEDEMVKAGSRLRSAPSTPHTRAAACADGSAAPESRRPWWWRPSLTARPWPPSRSETDRTRSRADRPAG